MKRAVLAGCAVILALIGSLQLSWGVAIGVKATAAQWLMERAWSHSRAGHAQVRPWRWADTWPVARLKAPAADVNLIVLAGISGRTLAFGPGWLKASSWPGQPGTALIAGHRDTHFAFLQRLVVDDLLSVETADGRQRWYRVASVGVADSRHTALAMDHDEERLVLVTCYPFDAIQAGGPLRLVVEALRVRMPSRKVAA